MKKSRSLTWSTQAAARPAHPSSSSIPAARTPVTGNCGNNGVFDALVVRHHRVTCRADPDAQLWGLRSGGRKLRHQHPRTAVAAGQHPGPDEFSSPPAIQVRQVARPVTMPKDRHGGFVGILSRFVCLRDRCRRHAALQRQQHILEQQQTTAQLGSAIGYIPEVAWNDTAAYGSLTASGGGFSKIFGKPSWQAGSGCAR